MNEEAADNPLVASKENTHREKRFVIPQKLVSIDFALRTQRLGVARRASVGNEARSHD
jgi:hypothetical protein